MELCFNEMTVMKNGTLPEDIALCAQAGLFRRRAAQGHAPALSARRRDAGGARQTLEEQHVRAGESERA